MDPAEQTYTLSPAQAIGLLSLAALIKEGGLSFRGYERDDEDAATSLLADVAQELALQVGP